MNKQFSIGGKNKNAGKQQWVHPPEALLRGHIVYNVKFLGHVECEQPKGTEVVRDAIRKMKFNKQLKKAEGQKPPKVELTVSVDGLTVQEPKYKVIQHQYPLHRISYCADDKADKRMFTFIAKEADTAKHHCFVFDSDKCAEEITLTIGQAFNLAYKKFMESSSKDMDLKKQFLLMQKKVQTLTAENLGLKERVADLERMVDPQVLENFDMSKKNGTLAPAAGDLQHNTEAPEVGRKLENLLMEDTAPATPPRNGTMQPPSTLPILAPPPPVPSRSNAHHKSATPSSQQPAQSGEVDAFGQTPFSPTSTTPGGSANPTNPFNTGAATMAGMGGMMGGHKSVDPFGMETFSPTGNPAEIDQQIMNMDRELMDLQAGFSQGLSFGTENFSLDDLDPLK